MQKLAEKVADGDADKAVTEAAAKDEQTRKQINDIQDALNGKDPAPANGADKPGAGAETNTEKLATDAVAKAVTGSVLPAAAAAKPRNPGEIPENLSEETGAALKRFDSLLNGTAKLDRGDFASRLKSRFSGSGGGTTALADKAPVAPVARVGRGEEPGVRRINKASISGTDPQPEYVPPVKMPEPVVEKSAAVEPVESKIEETKSAEVPAAEEKVSDEKAVTAKAIETEAAKSKPEKSEAAPAESKTAEKTDTKSVRSAPAKPAEAAQMSASAAPATAQPAPAPVVAEPAPAPNFDDEDGSEISAVGKGDTRVDFFAIRRSLRQLQFNYSINKPHDDSIRDEFEMILGNFSKMSVMYQSMSEDHAKRADERDKLIKARNDVRELTAELHRAQQQEKSAEARRKKDLEAFSQLTARQNASRSELREAQEQIEALKREMKEQAQDFETKHAESMKLVEDASLAEAEKTVLRDSLTEACDKIAELLSGELRNESIIQALEDELEHYRVNAGHSEAG